MDMTSLDSNQLNSITYLVGDGERIREHFEKFVARLRNISEENEVYSRLGVVIGPVADGKVRITSPLGDAIGSLSLVVHGVAILGKWAIRKEVESVTGSIAFSTVAEIYFTTDGKVHRGLADESPIRARANIIREEDREAYDVLLSIVFLIGFQP